MKSCRVLRKDHAVLQGVTDCQLKELAVRQDVTGCMPKERAVLQGLRTDHAVLQGVPDCLLKGACSPAGCDWLSAEGVHVQSCKYAADARLSSLQSVRLSVAIY